MIEDKKSFVMYTSHSVAVRQLSREDAGDLFKGIFDYVEHGMYPELSEAANMAFIFIKDVLDRNAEKYARVCQQKAEAGRRGGVASGKARASKSKQTEHDSEKEYEKENESGGEGDSDITPPSPLEGGRVCENPPTQGQIERYCSERGNNIDPASFFDYYSSNGWMVGSNKMRDWRAAVREWERRKKDEKQSVAPSQPDYSKPQCFDWSL
ncbi:MAG: DUF6291 domain-containing protein [Oscillospiraceae bacterium]|nr:DUF6291 domain-containing protein [Oscillospiraceae bacterium]